METPSDPASPGLHDSKVCIVTGASSGLGESIAVMFAQRGASVTLCGRDENRLQSALTSCTEVSGGHGERFITVEGDVRDSATRKHIVQKTLETFGRLDVLVASAGVSDEGMDILTATEHTYDLVMDTNVKAVFFQIQEAVPHLQNHAGNIVVISSNTSQFAHPTTTYPMSKAAVDHMVRCLAVDLGPKDIRVNSVNPGFVPTRIITRFVGMCVDRSFSHQIECWNACGPLLLTTSRREPILSFSLSLLILGIRNVVFYFLLGECLFYEQDFQMLFIWCACKYLSILCISILGKFLF